MFVWASVCLCVCVQVLDHEVSADFIDLNCGCPIDVICNRGSGSKLMTRPRKLVEMVSALGGYVDML